MQRKKIKEYSQALLALTKGASSEQMKKIAFEFVKYLAENGALSFATEIVEEFIKLEKKEQGTYTAQVTTTKPVDGILKKNIENALGKSVNLVEKTDPSILGGIVVKTEDIILDGSLKTQILNLKKAMIA